MIYMIYSFPRRRVEQLAARRAHNPEVGGSSPLPAKIKSIFSREDAFLFRHDRVLAAEINFGVK